MVDTERNMSTAAGRRALAVELISVEADGGDVIDMVCSLQRLCRAAARNLPIMAVAVSLMSDAGSAGAVGGADEQSVRLEELQFTLGEGPSHEAFALRRPVLTSDLLSRDGARWPGYSSAALEAGVKSVFAFPLHIGAATFGVLNMYGDHPGPLDHQQLTLALTFAEIATEILLDGGTNRASGQLHPGVETVLSYRAEIYQAQGSVMVDLGVTLADALVRMRAHAFVNSQSLAELSKEILSGRVELGVD